MRASIEIRRAGAVSPPSREDWIMAWCTHKGQWVQRQARYVVTQPSRYPFWYAAPACPSIVNFIEEDETCAD